MYASKYRRLDPHHADESLLECWFDDVWDSDDEGFVPGWVTGEADRDEPIAILPERFKCPHCGCERCESKSGFIACAWCHGYGPGPHG